MDKAIEKVKKRMQEMREIEDGWYNGMGEAIPNILVDEVETFTLLLIHKGIPKPLIGPTVDETGISLEWHTDYRIVCVEFILDDPELWFQSMDRFGDFYEELIIKISDKDRVSKSVEFLKKFGI